MENQNNEVSFKSEKQWLWQGMFSISKNNKKTDLQSFFFKFILFLLGFLRIKTERDF